MKRLLLIILLIWVLFGCDSWVEESVYQLQNEVRGTPGRLVFFVERSDGWYLERFSSFGDDPSPTWSIKVPE